MLRKKICILVNSRANYARIKTALQAIQKRKKLQLQLVIGASAVLDRFGDLTKIIKKDGFKIVGKIYSIVEGENPTTMAKSTGLAIIELSNLFENLKPDIVLTVADRFETLATAIAASYMNIPLAHTQGGEVTGSIDESVRHAITKLSNIHFPATKLAKRNIIKMGENPKNVYLTGCPSIDLAKKVNPKISKNFFSYYGGVGPKIDPKKPYMVVLQHPVTTEYGSGIKQINQTIEAVNSIKIQTVWLWPNVDAGSDEISKGLRTFREIKKPKLIHFYKNFKPEDYLKLIKNCTCIIGNSSSAIREGSFLGIPAVNIGTRQKGREHGKNIIFSDYNSKNISRAIRKQLLKKKYKKENIFGNGNSGEKIAKILSKINIKVQKKLNY
tara:strand:+ start:1123 stop:2274 length:1152 start_codon:yes stop_codon:yes gene_type:complete